MFKKLQNLKSKSKDSKGGKVGKGAKGGKRKKNEPVIEPVVEQPPEMDASQELDLPLDETSPDTLEPKVDKATQTLESDDSSCEDDLPPELRMDFIPKIMLATQHKAATFVVLKQEKKADRLNFRLRADIDPDWLRREHALREEERLRVQRELERVPILKVKPKSRINYLQNHKLKNVDTRTVVIQKETKTQPKAPKASPRTISQKGKGAIPKGAKNVRTTSPGKKPPGKPQGRTENKPTAGSKPGSRSASPKSLARSVSQGRGKGPAKGRQGKSPQRSRATTPRGSPGRKNQPAKGSKSKSPNSGKTAGLRGLKKPTATSRTASRSVSRAGSKTASPKRKGQAQMASGSKLPGIGVAKPASSGGKKVDMRVVAKKVLEAKGKPKSAVLKSPQKISSKTVVLSRKK